MHLVPSACAGRLIGSLLLVVPLSACDLPLGVAGPVPATLESASATHSGKFIYEYRGDPFTSFSCGPSVPGPGDINCATPAADNPLTSYLATDFVSAVLTLHAPLPANLTYQDVGNFAGFQLTMNDGRHTVTDADAAGMFAEVSTDADGDILHWRLVINTGGVENGGIVTMKFIDNTNILRVRDSGTLACCSPTILGDFASIFNSPGSWTLTSTTSPALLTSDLIDLLSDPLLGLSDGQQSSLADKLNSALASIEAGLTKQATNQLLAFVNSVEAMLKTGRISAATATTLLDAADAIIALLGGSAPVRQA